MKPSANFSFVPLRRLAAALQNRLASLDPTADAVPPLMVPRVAQVLGGQLPAVFPKYPNVSHQEQNRPLTHFSLLISHIRKTPPCPTAISRPHSGIPDLSHQEQNRPLTHLYLLILHIRKPLTCPRCKKLGKNCFWGGKTESKAKNEAKIAR